MFTLTMISSRFLVLLRTIFEYYDLYIPNPKSFHFHRLYLDNLTARHRHIDLCFCWYICTFVINVNKWKAMDSISSWRDSTNTCWRDECLVKMEIWARQIINSVWNLTKILLCKILLTRLATSHVPQLPHFPNFPIIMRTIANMF